MDIEMMPLSLEIGERAYDLFQNIGENENGFINEACGMQLIEYRQWLKKMDAWSRGECLPEGYVKQWSYILVVDGRPIGFGKIRESLTDDSRKSGGNIGYAIDQRFRGKGYGTELVSRLIAEAKRLGVKERLLTVRKKNYASKKAIEKSGARLVAENDTWWYFEA